MKWERHPTTERQERYHLGCRILGGGDRHSFEVSVIRRESRWEVLCLKNQREPP